MLIKLSKDVKVSENTDPQEIAALALQQALGIEINVKQPGTTPEWGNLRRYGIGDKFIAICSHPRSSFARMQMMLSGFFEKGTIYILAHVDNQRWRGPQVDLVCYAYVEDLDAKFGAEDIVQVDAINDSSVFKPVESLINELRKSANQE